VNYLSATTAFIVFLFGTSNANSEEAVSPMCEAVARFANATTDGNAHSVELYTDWGGEFSPKPAIFTKECKSFDYEPGKEFCHFLLRHTSTEFAMDNFSRVARCFKRQRNEKVSDVFPDDVWRASSDAVPGVAHGLRLGAEFAPKTKTTPPVLRVFVQDLTPDEVVLPSQTKKTIGMWMDGDRCTKSIEQIDKHPYLVRRCSGETVQFGVELSEISPKRFIKRRLPKAGSYLIETDGVLTIYFSDGSLGERLQPQMPSRP
jgi:hypothetical protein